LVIDPSKNYDNDASKEDKEDVTAEHKFTLFVK